MTKKGCLYSEDNIKWFDCSPFFKALQDRLEEFDCKFDLKEVNTPKESDFVFYFNMPTQSVLYPEKSYIWIAEPPVIYKRNFKKKKFKNFKRVFTWDTNLVDGKKFIKFNYPQIFNEIDFDLTKKEKLCCLIAKNKTATRKNELFSERQNAFLWFEKNAKEDFDLFGSGWEEGIKRRFLFLNYKVKVPSFYKGTVVNKFETLKKYKFSIAYENWKNKRGYITEKIFDCFNSSNVPIYLGEENIEKYIPKECFIDKRDFKTYEKLYSYIKNMDDGTYLVYLKNIQNYLNSNAALEFGFQKQLDIITGEVL